MKLQDMDDQTFLNTMKSRVRRTITREMRSRGEKLEGREQWIELAVTSACVILWHDGRMKRGAILTTEEIGGYDLARREAHDAAAKLGIPPYPLPALDHEVN